MYNLIGIYICIYMYSKIIKLYTVSPTPINLTVLSTVPSFCHPMAFMLLILPKQNQLRQDEHVAFCI